MKFTAPAGKIRVLKVARIVRRVLMYLVVLCFAFLVFQYGCYKVDPRNDSMAPTYPPGGRVLYDRLFRWHEGAWPAFPAPNHGIYRGNVVLFRKKVRNLDYLGIGRAVAVPGDTITFGPEGIAVNGRVYAVTHPHRPHTEVVPPDRFFILNDNQASDIQDSRQFGYVSADELVGKVFMNLGRLMEGFHLK